MFKLLHPLSGRVAILLALAAPSVATVQAEDFYKGKTVRLLIGYGAGGGYDQYGRHVARHFGKHLPGNPAVVPTNMPGAGGLTLLNYLANVAPRDGTEFGTFSRSAPLLAFSGESNQVKYDPLKLTWIGTSSSYAGEAYLMAVRKDTGIKSFRELQTTKRQLNFAATAAGSDGHDVPLALRTIYNINSQVVRGYPGGNTLYLAVDRGEMDARMVGYASVKTAHPEWLKPDSPVNFLLQFATDQRLPEFPNVPTAKELVNNDEDRALITLMETPFFMARPFAGPPEIPAERAKLLRTAFMAAHEDPAYKEEAGRLRLIVSPKSGEEVQKLVEQLGKMPKKLYKRYASLLTNPNSKLRTVNWVKVSGVVVELGKKGRFTFETADKKEKHKARMLGNYTKVKVDGKDVKAKAVVAGMTCDIWWEGPKSTPGRVECKK